jgi:hypothetical protein
MTTAVNANAGEEWDVLIDRQTKWGNPFPLKDRSDRQERVRSLRKFCWYLINRRQDLIEAAKVELAGKRLGCHCKPSDCHGDVWAEICDHVEDDAFLDKWFRASGDCECQVCGLTYRDHRPYMGSLSTIGYERPTPWLHVTCAGYLVKT